MAVEPVHLDLVRAARQRTERWQRERAQPADDRAAADEDAAADQVVAQMPDARALAQPLDDLQPHVPPMPSPWLQDGEHQRHVGAAPAAQARDRQREIAGERGELAAVDPVAPEAGPLRGAAPAARPRRGGIRRPRQPALDPRLHQPLDTALQTLPADRADRPQDGADRLQLLLSRVVSLRYA